MLAGAGTAEWRHAMDLVADHSLDDLAESRGS